MLLKMSRKYDGDQKIHATEFRNSKHAESFNNLYNNYTIGYLWYATLILDIKHEIVNFMLQQDNSTIPFELEERFFNMFSRVK